MSGWIKICGLTTSAGVEAALACGVDAIGFVFATSVRRVTPMRAAELSKAVRQQLTCIAVTLHPSQFEVDEIVREFHPDMLQTDAADFERLKLPSRLARLPVMRSGEPERSEYPMRVLFEGPRSGSGQVGDWTQAAALAKRTRLVLAGGLNPGNVADAIRGVRPWGVDASSGVEGRPGQKSPELIRQFVHAARAAFSEIKP
jgi:phosphoribosylanthranilate isomerase